MSSWSFSPDFTQALELGLAQDNIIPATLDGMVMGGSGLSGFGTTPTNTGGLVMGGQADIVSFTVSFTYVIFANGGMIIGGEASLPGRFHPDPNFVPEVDAGLWVDDANFPGNLVGGD